MQTPSKQKSWVLEKREHKEKSENRGGIEKLEEGIW